MCQLQVSVTTASNGCTHRTSFPAGINPSLVVLEHASKPACESLMCCMMLASVVSVGLPCSHRKCHNLLRDVPIKKRVSGESWWWFVSGPNTISSPSDTHTAPPSKRPVRELNQVQDVPEPHAIPIKPRRFSAPSHGKEGKQLLSLHWPVSD